MLKEASAKNAKACRAEDKKLSARQPRVFGVSLRSKTLKPSQTAITHQERGACTCSRQMYKPTKPVNPSASSRQEILRKRVTGFSSPARCRPIHGVTLSSAAHSCTNVRSLVRMHLLCPKIGGVR